MAGPLFGELEELELENLKCDVDECDHKARYIVVWASHVKMACAECSVEISDKAWPDVATLFGRGKSPTYSDGSPRLRRPRTKLVSSTNVRPGEKFS
jgi:hypothetical protein